MVNGLAAPPEGKVYEAWVSPDGKTFAPAGTFTATDGLTTAVLDKRVPANGLVAVTVEDGPVAQPTSAPIITAPTA